MDTLSVIISGVAVFIIGEIFIRFFLAPIHKFKEIKGEIASVLLFHANNYGKEYKNLADILGTTGGDERVINERIESDKMWNNDLSKASDETRAVAAKLISVAEGIPFYNLISLIRVVPSKENIIKARKQLIALSNSFSTDQAVPSADRSDDICNILNIEFMNE